MGDQNTVLDALSARQLLRRSGFGAAPVAVQDIVSRGLTRGQAADELLAFVGKAFKPNGKYIEDAHNKWVKYMIKTKFPVQQKLVIYWHHHFATSNDKVQHPKIMANQIRLMHLMAKGNFKDFVKAMNKDAALMEFLDTPRNHRDDPNENYARELQELFTLGVNDFAGNPNYTQQDIVQIKRAFSGWDYEYNSGKAVFHDYDHDYNTDYLGTRGPKVIYQSTGGFGAGGKAFDANGEGAPEIDTVIDIIFQHRDTDGKNTVARHVARRLVAYLAYPIAKAIQPSDVAVIDQVIADSSFDTTWDIGALVRAIFVHDAFYYTAAAAPFDASTLKSVKWPIDFTVSTLRLLGMKLKSKSQYVDASQGKDIRDQLANMGQLLLQPPSVFGWDWESAWISSATLLARYEFAREVTGARGGGSSAFRPERFMDLSLTDPDNILAAVTDALGITDQFTATERNDLVDYLTDNGTNMTLNLNDYDTRNRKLNGLFALVLQSPAYQLH
jgi:uncharacterized protein (DUF1800 family)